jgi:hypothetical protein
MLFVLAALQQILALGLLFLLAQGALRLLSPTQAHTNPIYQLFAVLNRPWLALARWCAPASLAARHRGWLAFVLLSVAYVLVTLARIERCVAVAMVGCK